jgi:hypothetical protein
MFHNFTAEHSDMMVEYFQGIKTEQLQRVIKMRHLSSLETVIIDMGTNDLKTTRDLDFVLGEVYALMAKAKREFRTANLS